MSQTTPTKPTWNNLKRTLADMDHKVLLGLVQDLYSASKALTVGNIVVAFLFVLIQSILGKKFNRNATRAIKNVCKVSRPDQRLIDPIAAAFIDISKDDWGVQCIIDVEDAA